MDIRIIVIGEIPRALQDTFPVGWCTTQSFWEAESFNGFELESLGGIISDITGEAHRLLPDA